MKHLRARYIKTDLKGICFC